MRGSDELRIFMDGLPDYILYIISDMFFRVFVQLVRVNRIAVFNYDMSFPDFRKMVFEDFGCIVHGDRNHCTSGLRGNLQGAVAEWQHGQLFAPVARPFGEDADGDAIFDIIDCLKDRF